MRFSSISAAVFSFIALAVSSPVWAQHGLSSLIRLERTSATTWALSYSLSQPVDALDFGSPIGEYQAEAWRPAPEFAWAGDDSTLLLRRRDGAAFDRASLVLEVWDQLVPKQYAPCNTFSDGGASLFTGFFEADGRKGARSLPAETAFEFVPLAGESVIIGGVRHESASRWTPSGESAFVYFGEARPIETDSLIAILDPQTPAWARDRLESFLPKVFAFYAERFGVALDRRPTVLISARFDDGNKGYSIKGGALAAQIQVRLRGQKVREKGSGLDDYLFKFIAHEGAHLWQDPSRFDNASAWIHEGGAEGLALLAVRELEVWSQEKVEAAHDAAAGQCAEHLRQVTLENAGEKGAFDAYYSCGLLIAGATDQALRQQDGAADLFAFWRQLVTSGQGDASNTQAYFATLEALGVAEETRDAIRQLVRAEAGDVTAIIDRLRRLDPRPRAQER